MNTLAEKQGRRTFAEGRPRINPYKYHYLNRGWWFYGYDDAERRARDNERVRA